MTPTQTDLLRRVREAVGPDRELDADIARWQGWTSRDTENDWHDLVWCRPDGQPCPLRSYTASLDDALELVERARPGTWWSVSVDRTGGYEGRISAEGHLFIEEGLATPALALVAALLLASPANPDEGE